MPDAEIPPFAQASAGACGSLVSNTIVYPLDLLSTRTQTSGSRAAQKSTWRSLQELLHQKGVGGLYQGLGTDNLSNTISNFLFFFFRAALTEKLHQRKLSRAGPSGSGGKKPTSIPLTPGEDLFVGALAGMCSRAFTTPLSNVTVRKQTASSSASKGGETEGKGKGDSKGKGRQFDDEDSSDEENNFEDEPSITDVINDIVKDKGIFGLWSGFETAILLSITPSLTFGFTNLYTRLLMTRKARESPNSAQIFVTSALGNATATTILYPLVIAKTLLQYRSPSGRRMYNNLIEVIVKVTRKRGLSGLYQGLSSQLLKSVVSFAVTMLLKSRIEEGFIAAYLAMRRRGKVGGSGALVKA